MYGVRRELSLAAMVMLAFQVSAWAQSPPAPDTSNTDIIGATPPTVLPPVTIEASSKPSRAARPSRLIAGTHARPTQHRTASDHEPAPVAVPGAPNVGSGPVSPLSMASQITLSGQELNARPATRPGEVLEAVPGLIVTQHSGEGKATSIFYAATIWTTERISRSMSTTSPSTCERMRMARATPTSTG